MNWILWAVVGVVAAVGAILAISGSSRRRQIASREAAAKNAGDSTTIYTSGVFSLIRKSPRETVSARIPDVEKIRSALSAAGVSGDPEAYLARWREVAELCINNVEQGDKEGIQTYRYEVPEPCRATCGKFGGEAYVTRDQLHHQPQLIPPFHLGCGCVIRPRGAWEGGPGGWSPILPVNGQYEAPDWRVVVRL
jgi:hypothetical protein